MIRPIITTVVLLSTALVCCGTAHSQSAKKPAAPKPLNGSARVAAQLAYHPATAWQAHYLPADRYRLGTIWPVVSTELDVYYHRPNCPLMMNQPADIVLGFASSADAVEGGYRACTTCRPQIPVVVYARAPTYTNQGQAAAESREASRIVNALADLIAGTNKQSDLLLIRRAVDGLQQGTVDSAVRAVLKKETFRAESLAMTAGSLQNLKRAIDDKIAGPNPAGISLWRIYLQNARSEARPTTPQIAAQQQQQFNDATAGYTRSFTWQGNRRGAR